MDERGVVWTVCNTNFFIYRDRGLMGSRQVCQLQILVHISPYLTKFMEKRYTILFLFVGINLKLYQSSIQKKNTRYELKLEFQISVLFHKAVLSLEWTVVQFIKTSNLKDRESKRSLRYWNKSFPLKYQRMMILQRFLNYIYTDICTCLSNHWYVFTAAEAKLDES